MIGDDGIILLAQSFKEAPALTYLDISLKLSTSKVAQIAATVAFAFFVPLCSLVDHDTFLFEDRVHVRSTGMALRTLNKR